MMLVSGEIINYQSPLKLTAGNVTLSLHIKKHTNKQRNIWFSRAKLTTPNSDDLFVAKCYVHNKTQSFWKCSLCAAVSANTSLPLIPASLSGKLELGVLCHPFQFLLDVECCWAGSWVNIPALLHQHGHALEQLPREKGDGGRRIRAIMINMIAVTTTVLGEFS